LGERLKGNLKMKPKKINVEAVKLQTTLSEVIPEVIDFLDNCNTLMTGVGKENEYLLDLCSVNSRACLDEEGDGKHAGCCCGYNPITSLGSEPSATGLVTIAGVSAKPNLWRTTGRRLTTASLNGSIDICGEAQKMSKDAVENYNAQIQDAQPDVLENNKKKLEAEYQAYFARCTDIKEGAKVKITNEPDPTTTKKPTVADLSIKLQPNYVQIAALVLTWMVTMRQWP